MGMNNDLDFGAIPMTCIGHNLHVLTVQKGTGSVPLTLIDMQYAHRPFKNLGKNICREKDNKGCSSFNAVFIVRCLAAFP